MSSHRTMSTASRMRVQAIDYRKAHLVAVAMPLGDLLLVAVELLCTGQRTTRTRSCDVSKTFIANLTLRYSAALVRQSLTKTVVRAPKRMVPPRLVNDTSGILITTGYLASGFISVECDSVKRKRDQKSCGGILAYCSRPPTSPQSATIRTRQAQHVAGKLDHGDLEAQADA